MLTTEVLTTTPMHYRLKIVAVILLLVTAYFASIGAGVYMLTSSELFPFAKKALAAHLVSINSKDAGETLHLKWFAPWPFIDRPSNRHAQFLLCTPTDHCYPITAVKIDDVWHLDWTFKTPITNSSR